ncbi:MAG: integrase zinc binding domain-containing protein, partial [bacterium]
RRMVTRRFIWKGCGADVARWCRDCQDCQRGKITRKPRRRCSANPSPSPPFFTSSCGLGRPAAYFA